MSNSELKGSKTLVSDKQIQSKRNRYQMLTALWVFPSLGALLILTVNHRNGVASDFLKSPRIEDLAALAVLFCHLLFGIQSRRFHQLLQDPKRTRLTSTDK